MSTSAPPPLAAGSQSPTNTATIRHLRAFILVARLRSFTQAAQELGLSQPSLTVAIRQLEDIVGSPLFERTTRNIALTSDGIELFPVAERLVDDFDHAIQDIRRSVRHQASTIRIAVVSSVATRILPRILERFMRDHPQLRVIIREGNSNDVRRMVANNEVDVGVASKTADEPELRFQPLFRDKLGLFIHRSHPLLARHKGGDLNWKDLEGYTFLGLTQDTATGPILSQIDYLPASVRHPRFVVSTYATLFSLVQHGIGITTAPALAAEAMEDQDVFYVDMQSPISWRTVHLVTRVGRQQLPPVRHLLHTLETELKEIAQHNPRIEYLSKI